MPHFGLQRLGDTVCEGAVLVPHFGLSIKWHQMSDGATTSGPNVTDSRGKSEMIVLHFVCASLPVVLVVNRVVSVTCSLLSY